MFEELIRVMLSADLGAAGGGGDAGGSESVTTAGSESVGPGDASSGTSAQPFNYEEVAKRYGGPEGLQKALQWHDDMHNRAKYNPQFRETVERALRGEFGPQAQQQAQQQQGQPQGQPQQQGGGWLKYEPATLVQMQNFHRELERARASGDPEAVKEVFGDPMHRQAAEAYQKHQQEMNNSWWNPREFHQKMWNDEEMKQMRQREYEEAIQAHLGPMQQQFDQYQRQQWYQANKARVDPLPQHIKDAVNAGAFGPVGTVQEGIAAVERAIAEHQKLVAAGNPTGQVAPNATAPGANRLNGNQRPPTNGVKREDQQRESDRDVDRKYAEDMKKARLAEKS